MSAREALRVLLVSPAPVAGTVQYAHNLAANLGRRGHEVALLTGVGCELAPYASDYRMIEAIDRLRPRPDLWRTLWRALRELRPQIIHYQGGQHPDLLYALDLALRTVTPARHARAIYTPQEIQSNNARPWHGFALRRFWPRLSHVFFNSEDNRVFTRDRMGLDVGRSDVATVPDLMDFLRRDVTPKMPDVPDGCRLALCLGLIEPRKGIPTLIKSFARVAESLPDAHLAVVGKPLMDIEPLRASIDALGLTQRVTLLPTYLGFEDMAGWFERASTVVLPYEAGWNSGVIPVAFGYRKPVIATRIASADEIVEHERNGLLVEPAAPDDLAAAILRILGDDALREAMQPQIEATARKLGWQTLTERTEQVYRDVLRA
jgi:glycosyltransferase involved in cell wall biosynthesis